MHRRGIKDYTSNYLVSVSIKHSIEKMLVLFWCVILFFSTSAEKARFDNYRVYNIKIENGEQLDALKFLADTSDSVK